MWTILSRNTKADCLWAERFIIVGVVLVVSLNSLNLARGTDVRPFIYGRF